MLGRRLASLLDMMSAADGEIDLGVVFGNLGGIAFPTMPLLTGQLQQHP